MMQRSSIDAVCWYVETVQILLHLCISHGFVHVIDITGVEDLSFAKFMQFHQCYDVMPSSSKLVVFDIELKVALLSISLSRYLSLSLSLSLFSLSVRFI